MLLTRNLALQQFPRLCGSYHGLCAWNHLFRHRLLAGARHHSSSAAEIKSRNPSTVAAAETHFLVRYLVDSCGFSKKVAAEVSKPVLARVESTENPDAVLSFLKEEGFTKGHIRRVLLADPGVLCASVRQALEPKIRALKDAGFSGSDIAELFSRKPRAFRVSDFGDKVRFWETVFDPKERLLKAILKNSYLIFSSLDEKMKPNASLLYECLESKHRVSKIISRRHRLLTANTATLKEVIKRVEDLGIPRGSGLFAKALYVLIENSFNSFDAKFALLKSFGWSESEFLSAIQKNPTFLGSSKEKIESIMDFLVKEVGCESSYVAAHPNILTLSLEGRILPRHCVLSKLTSKGLIDEGYDFYNVVCMTEKGFLNRYVLRHSEKAPELYQSYVAACTRGNPS